MFGATPTPNFYANDNNSIWRLHDANTSKNFIDDVYNIQIATFSAMLSVSSTDTILTGMNRNFINSNSNTNFMSIPATS